ncbi:MAG: hypothetical protein J0H98_03485 [Solirubrobacterales bacterium]|nr:hypothetical protein [Solirubrobacterales bacterium]
MQVGPDTEQTKYRRELSLYRWHRAVSILLTGVAGGLAWFLAPAESTGLWEMVRHLMVVGALLFMFEWLVALMFQRKSRPWRLSRHPDDRKPRPPAQEAVPSSRGGSQV